MSMLVIGTNVTNDILKIAIYPTLSPNLEELFYKQEALPSVITACDNLYQKKWPLKSSIRKQVTHYFEQFYSIEAFTHHIEMEILRKKIDYSKLRIPLEQQFPQFVWTQIGINHVSDEKSNLFLEFIPIAYTDEEFPFTIQLDASLQQQVSTGVSDVNDFKEQLAKIVQSVIDEQNVTFVSRPKAQVHEEKRQGKTDAVKKELEDTVEFQKVSADEPPKFKKKVRKKSSKKKQAKKAKQLPKVNANELALEEEAKRERASKERLRLANQKLEIYIENLEASLIKNSIHYLNSLTDEEDENWHTQLKISLREYTYLFQKAKYLEQVWRINDNLVQKIEKMTLNEKELTYERGQVQQVVDNNLSAKDISLVFYECSVIESRVKLYERPWFRKPYARIMKMDYDNLLRKAAYFDLLQSESYLLEKKALIEGNTDVRSSL